MKVLDILESIVQFKSKQKLKDEKHIKTVGKLKTLVKDHKKSTDVKKRRAGMKIVK